MVDGDRPRGQAARPWKGGQIAARREIFSTPGPYCADSWRESAKPMGIARQRPEMGILLREFRRPSDLDEGHSIENTIVDTARREPRGVHERNPSHASRGADRRRPVGE